MTSSASVKFQDLVELKTDQGFLLVILPRIASVAADDWQEIVQSLKFQLNKDSSSSTAGTPVYIVAQDRLLDARQLQELAKILEQVELKLHCVRTSRRQTAVATATAGYNVEQEALVQPLNTEAQQPPPIHPLYLKTTVRSGVTIRHQGSVIIQGDVNPGGEVIAEGNIIIWGCLRGVAHAGVKGDRTSTISALRLIPTQLRIAEKIARVPESPDDYFEPEVAYITNEGIRISPASNFGKAQRRMR